MAVTKTYLYQFLTLTINLFHILLALFLVVSGFQQNKKKSFKILYFHEKYILIPPPSRFFTLTVSLPVKHMKVLVVNFTFQSQKLKIWLYVW